MLNLLKYTISLSLNLDQGKWTYCLFQWAQSPTEHLHQQTHLWMLTSEVCITRWSNQVFGGETTIITKLALKGKGERIEAVPNSELRTPNLSWDRASLLAWDWKKWRNLVDALLTTLYDEVRGWYPPSYGSYASPTLS